MKIYATRLHPDNDWEPEPNDNSHDVSWEGFEFEVITDGINTVKELICNSSADEFLQHVYMVRSDDDLSTAIYRATGCDFDSETEVYFS